MSAERPAFRASSSLSSSDIHSVASSRALHASEASVGMGRPWIWPLPRLDGAGPSVVAVSEQAARDGVVHLGYQGRSSSPSLVPVFAARDGIVSYATRSQRGASICLDHPGGWSTEYDELEHVLATSTDRFRRRRKVRVRAGDVLGHARRSSLRIRFALSKLADGQWLVVNPAESMHDWSMLPWFSDTPSVASRVA